MILHVTKATYMENYRIEVSFNDGKTGTVDLSQSLTGYVFNPLKDILRFVIDSINHVNANREKKYESYRNFTNIEGIS